MPSILTVDDSRAVRTIVSKQVKDLGFDVVEAEDGQQGLAKLSECQFDLVLLDVTMPVMDGPTMLAKMREGGNQTPVIMLTAESKRTIVSEAMKAGITDYILKPFKPEELRNKILAVLQGESPAEAIIQSGPEPQAAAAGGAAAPVRDGSKQFVDLLIIDDMENVHKKLRSMLPTHLTVNAFTSAQQALGACRERVYRVILIDTDIPDVNSAVLAQQIKVLQPHSAFVALALRTTNDVVKEARDQGFNEVLFKPFQAENVEEFLAQWFDNQELVTAEENVLHVTAFNGRPERLDRYFTRLGDLFPGLLDKVAAACHEHVVVDMGKVPVQGDKLPKLLINVAARARDIGIGMSVVGSPDVQKLLAGFEETSAIRCFASVQDAHAASA